jgi:hypothetical protein
MGYTIFSLFNLFKGEKQMKAILQDLWNILSRSELWVTVAMVLGTLKEANTLPEGWVKVVVLLLGVLTALGYTTNRTIKKMNDTK